MRNHSAFMKTKFSRLAAMNDPVSETMRVGILVFSLSELPEKRCNNSGNNCYERWQGQLRMRINDIYSRTKKTQESHQGQQNDGCQFGYIGNIDLQYRYEK